VVLFEHQLEQSSLGIQESLQVITWMYVNHGQAKQNELGGPLSRKKLGLRSEIELSLLHKTRPRSPEPSQKIQLIYFTQKYMQSIAKFLYIIFVSFIFRTTTLSERNPRLTDFFFGSCVTGLCQPF